MFFFHEYSVKKIDYNREKKTFHLGNDPPVYTAAHSSVRCFDRFLWHNRHPHSVGADPNTEIRVALFSALHVVR